MNSVSRPIRPSARARSASAVTSSSAKWLLPALGLPGRLHADRLVQAQRHAVVRVDAELGVLHAGAAELLEQGQQQRAAVAAAAGAGGDGQLPDPARVALP